MNVTSINLESLLDLSAKLVESNDASYILNSALLSLMGKLRVTKACALVPDATGMRVLIVKGKVGREHFSCMPGQQIFECADAHPELHAEGFVLCSTIQSNGVVRGAIALGPSLGAREYTETERHYVSLVSMIAAHALQSAEHMKSLLQEKSRVESRNQMLESLFEMSNDLGSLFTREQILQIFSFRLMGQVMVSRFALIVFHPDGTDDVAFNRFHTDFDPELRRTFRFLESACTMNDWQGSDEHRTVLQSCSTELLVPLFIKNEARGVLLVGKKMIGEFGEYDLRFIEALASTLATALENARLFEEELKKQRIESELNVARQIQHKLFPEHLPQLASAEVAAQNISSQQVGGDYFDVIQLSEHELLLAIADVSGKGMPASILMANVQAALRILAPLGLELSEVVTRMNDMLYENTGHDKFVTFFLARINTQSSVLEYCNAGHNPPMLFRASGEVEELGTGGLILGVMPTFRPYEQAKVELLPNDVVFLFTDGVNEAMNSEQVEFGDDQIRAKVKEVVRQSASVILDSVLRAVQKHAADAPQSDDITMVVVKMAEQKTKESQ